MTIPPDFRPRLASKAMLRFDRKTERHVLLYPEKGLVLNATGAEIVRLCTGERTIEAIVDGLCEKYTEQTREVLAAEVLAFVTALRERGLLVDEAAPAGGA